ncbi:DNA polymerase III subunit psi [Psychromonas aquatilis]|uniref:DNA polymerase III subunit psi n=1 Tax=Psychromonas aquatilis TaxID=2005072 RepID=A0ABU9GPY1_9GAMM
MKHQQALFLQEMGITHWQVRKPELFKAESTTKQLNLSTCKLLIVCTEQDQQHKLMTAIVSAFSIDIDDVVFCSLEQFENQQGSLPRLIWSTLGKISVAANTQLLHSPSLAVLSKDGKAKKLLWKQYCDHLQ